MGNELGIKTTTLKVPEITCGGCAASIRNVLSNDPSVSSVNVDVATKIVTIEYRDELALSDLSERLANAGFSCETAG